MSNPKHIEALFSHLYGDPIPLPDGRVEVALMPYVEWTCTCGHTCRCYDYAPLVMGFQCICERMYTVDWAHGLTPRVSLEED